MARTKKTSTVLETAWQRLAGIRSITPAPEFGSPLELAEYEREINNTTARLHAYNEGLSGIDQLQNEFEAAESNLRVMNRRILSAAEARYGPDSSEYEQVGGTRTSDRKRPGPRGTTPTTPIA